MNKSFSLDRKEDVFSIKNLPPEILFIIFEMMDSKDLLNCMYVSKQWQAVAVTVADTDTETWKQIVEYSGLNNGDTISLKSVNMEWKDIFINACLWQHVATAAFDVHCILKGDSIRKISVYQDILIIMDNNGAKCYHTSTHTEKRNHGNSESLEVLDTDDIILFASGAESFKRLVLYGKRHPEDLSMQADNEQIINNVKHYKIVKNSCYIIDFKNSIFRYIWRDHMWHNCRMSQFYGLAGNSALSLDVWNGRPYTLFSHGELYTCTSGRHYDLVMRVPLPDKGVMVNVTLTHLYCIMIGVRYAVSSQNTEYFGSNYGETFHIFECPDLSCVTQHGQMLILGYTTGKIEFFMPKALQHRNMVLRRLHITDFDTKFDEPDDLIIKSIDVFEDVQNRHLFVATNSRVYHVLVTNVHETIWGKPPHILPQDVLRPTEQGMNRHALTMLERSRMVPPSCS